MKTLLFINCCIRKDKSRTLELCNHYLCDFHSAMKEKGEEWLFRELALEDLNLKPMTSKELELRDKLLASGEHNHQMFNLANEIIKADRIIIGAPYWDLQFPALLKIYLERCSVTGITFIYNSKGIPAGQCKAEELTYITTSGSPIGDYNFGYEYIKGLSKLFGIRKTRFFSAEALDIIGNDVNAIMADAKEQISLEIKRSKDN